MSAIGKTRRFKSGMEVGVPNACDVVAASAGASINELLNIVDEALSREAKRMASFEDRDVRAELERTETNARRVLEEEGIQISNASFADQEQAQSLPGARLAFALLAEIEMARAILCDSGHGPLAWYVANRMGWLEGCMGREHELTLKSWSSRSISRVDAEKLLRDYEKLKRAASPGLKVAALRDDAASQLGYKNGESLRKALAKASLLISQPEPHTKIHRLK